MRLGIANELSVWAEYVEIVVKQNAEQLWLPIVIAKIAYCHSDAVVRGSKVETILEVTLILVHV